MKFFTRFLFTFLLFLSFLVNGQETSSWIKYDQKYVRVGVAVQGLQKVTFSQLQSAGLNVDVSNASRLQLFYRGNEVSIVKIENEDILFYGVLNDGASDSLLFRPYNSRANIYESKYSDKGSYFFTIGNTNGKRAITLNVTPTNPGLTPLTWHWEKRVTVLNTEYVHALSTSGIRHGLMQSYFRDGESLTGTRRLSPNNQAQTFSMTNRYTELYISPRIKYLVHGRSSNTNKFNVTINSRTTSSDKNLVPEASIIGFKASVSEFNGFSEEDLPLADGNMDLKFIASSNAISLGYAVLEYPQLTKIQEDNKYFYFDTSSESVDQISITNATKPSYTLLDVTNSIDPKVISHSVNSGNLSAYFNRSTNKKSELYLSSTATAISDNNIGNAANYTYISPSAYNYVIITNKTLRSAAEQFAEYRRSALGRNYNVLVMDIKDIYDQFNYGEPSPVAVIRFNQHITSDGAPNKHLLLLGWDVSYPTRQPRELSGRTRNLLSGQITEAELALLDGYDIIPTVGYPGSDLLLSANIERQQLGNIPKMATGRLPAIDPQHVLNYLEKVKIYEDPTKDSFWKKNAVTVSGGGKTGRGEVISISTTTQTLTPIIETGYVGGKVTRFGKDPDNFAINETLNISQQISEGLGILNFYGHGSAETIDYNFGYITHYPELYPETDKYPFMHYVGCGVSNVFSGRFLNSKGRIFEMPITTDWIFAKKKGSIAITANTELAYLGTGHSYNILLHNYMFNDANNYTIGEALVKTSTHNMGNSLQDVANYHQTILQGDPALKIVTEPSADYQTNLNDGLYVTSSDGSTIMKNASDILLAVKMRNVGRYNKNTQLKSKVILSFTDGTQKIGTFKRANVANSDTLFVSLNQLNDGNTNARTLSITDLKSIEVIINPNEQDPILEVIHSNNSSRINFNWDLAQDRSLWTSSDGGPLPVTITQFSASKESENSLLTWSTTNEVNFKEFEVERSSNGIDWQSIGTVQAKSNNLHKFTSYKFVDINTYAGVNYYRLKMIDLDNSYIYSNQKTVVISKEVELSISPNPADKEIRISSSLLEEENEVIVQDITGLILLKEVSKKDDVISVNHLKPGMYILKIKTSSGNYQVKKFVKK